MPGLGTDPSIRRGGLAIRGDAQMKSGTNYMTVVGGAGVQSWSETLEVDIRSLNHDAEMTQGDEFLFDVGGDQDYVVAGHIRSSGDLAIGVKSNFFVEADEATVTTTSTDINLVSQENILGSSVDDIEWNAGTDLRLAAIDDIHVLTGDSGGGVPFQRLQLDQAGAWRLGAGLDAGTATFVFTSNGVGAEPTWSQVQNTGLADMPANTYKMRSVSSGPPQDFAVATNSIPARGAGGLGTLSAGVNEVLRSSVTGLLAFGKIETDHIVGDLDQNARVGVRLNGGTTFIRRRINFIEQSGIDMSIADDSGSEEVDLDVGLATRGAQTLMGNPTGGAAVPSDISVPTESLVGRSSGNITTFGSSLHSTLIRSSGSLFFASAAANQVLRRAGSGDLGFGTLVTDNIGDNTVTNPKLANMAANTIKARADSLSGDPQDMSVSTESVVGRGSGNVGLFLSVANSALIRGSTGSVNFAFASTNEVLRRNGSGSLGFGLLTEGNITGQIPHTKTGALTGEVTKPSGSTATTIVRSTSFAGGNEWTGNHVFGGSAVQVSGALTVFGSATFVDPVRLQAITSVSLGSNTNNWSPSGLSTAAIIHVNVTANIQVTGLVAQSLGTIMVIRNTGSADQNLELVAESGSSSTANRFRMRDNADILPGEAMAFYYSTTPASGWYPWTTYRT